MPRRIDPKCLACAQLDATKAIALHGPAGDGCWDSKRCPRRRSHYRNRREANAKRRMERMSQQSGLGATHDPTHDLTHNPEVVTIESVQDPVAYLYLYREKRQDSPLHAISMSVWQGHQKLIEIAPIHGAGLRNRQVQAYLQKALDYLKERYGITKFEPEIRMEPTECPIRPCPLHHGSE